VPREPQDITEAELAVLRVLWRVPGLSIRQLTERLTGRRSAARYGTVQKQLERLEAKGFVHRDRSLPVHLFSADIDREALVGRRVEAMVEKLCDGSLTPIISQLLLSPKLSEQQRLHLRALVEETDEQGRRKV
jgi:BlaI family penicillinase repressor